ncbi:cellulose synthase subunit BcsC-related outer membrane protein [Roseomonas sp. CCTCC AB2023176]|uniref:cellulose synthase subunit BcsC-related outer membrane protein n=1 Tax=Roseomonas sp. CCTCC AB2023176 TaxID=3342640 RepID=UPI0035DCFE4D
MNDEAASRITVNGTIRGRSGTSGSERLMEYGGGVEGAVAVPGVGGTLTGRVQGVYIDSGRADVNDTFSLRRYGTNAVGISDAAGNQLVAPLTTGTLPRERYRPRDTSASGVALGVAYQRDWLAVDIGSTPLGFRESNVLGGIELTPSLGEGWRLRLRGERRAVTDSILSWAGVRDPLTGQTWGGVTRTGAYGQVEYGNQTFGAYAGGGYSIFRGRNVEDNSRFELAAGVSQAIFRRPTEELVTGLDLLYLSYDKNLRLFSFGHGGYFSPQQYFAAAVPLDYRARFGNVALRLGGSAGVSYFQEDRSPYYPTNRALQQEAERQTSADPTVQSFYQSQQRTNFAYGVRGDIEYAVTPSIRIGALARFDKVADFNEGRGMIYARFRLD